jgi:hypothetical protein
MRSSLLLCPLLIVSCASWTPPRNTKDEQKRFDSYEERMGAGYDGTLRTVSRINVSKPIGEFEAWALRNAYFYTVFGLCGGVERVTDRGTVWVASGAIGIAGGPAPFIYVDKATGATWAEGRQRITDPRIYAKKI